MLENYSLARLQILFEKLANASLFLKGYYYNTGWNIDATNPSLFPYLHIQPIENPFNQFNNNPIYQGETYNFQMVVMDKINKGDSNYINIHSSTNQILKEYIMMLQKLSSINKRGITVTSNALVPMFERTTEYVNGWSANVLISVPLILGPCNAAFDPDKINDLTF